MTLTVLWVALGSSFGAPARYLLDRAIQSRHDRGFPWGTLFVNVTGSLALGLLVGLSSHRDVADWMLPALGTGALGGYTTFSTYAWETLRLGTDGALAAAAANVLLSTSVSLAAAAAGLYLGGL